MRHRNHARINHYDRVISSRPNYHLLPDTTVARVLFEGNRTTGIEFLPTTGGNSTTVLTSKEVILAAGGLHTPQILQLSGVGPASLPASFGIGVVSYVRSAHRKWWSWKLCPILTSLKVSCLESERTFRISPRSRCRTTARTL